MRAAASSLIAIGAWALLAFPSCSSDSGSQPGGSGGFATGGTGGSSAGGSGGSGGSAGEGGSGGSGGIGGPIEVAGAITADAAWDGEVHLTADADIAAGVTVQLRGGATFDGAEGATLTVHGTLSIEGSAHTPVHMDSSAAWAGIVVEAGGSASLYNVSGSKAGTLLTCKTGAQSCVLDAVTFSDLGTALEASAPATISRSVFHDLTGSAVSIPPGGDVTISDTRLWGTPGDLVSVTGGKLTMSYSELGSTAAAQHTDLFISSATGIVVTYTDITNAVDGVLIGNTNGALLQYDNFTSNETDVGDLGNNIAVDLRLDYWDHGTPTLGAQYDLSMAQPARVDRAGPRM